MIINTQYIIQYIKQYIINLYKAVVNKPIIITVNNTVTVPWNKEAITKLEAAFPVQNITPTTDTNDIMFKAGQRSVVEVVKRWGQV